MNAKSPKTTLPEAPGGWEQPPKSPTVLLKLRNPISIVVTRCSGYVSDSIGLSLAYNFNLLR